MTRLEAPVHDHCYCVSGPMMRQNIRIAAVLERKQVTRFMVPKKQRVILKECPQHHTKARPHIP